MREDYREIFRNDPGFVIRSVVSRVYENIFRNANENYFPFWNWWLLGLAVAGAIFLFVQGGHRKIVAFTVAALFAAACAAIGFVYYINPNYANLTQLCLIVLACGVPDIAVRLIRPLRSARRPTTVSHALGVRLRRARRLSMRARWFLAVAAVALISLAILLTRPPVREYLGTPRTPEQWIAPEPMMPQDLTALVRAYQSLPAPQAARFLSYVRSVVPDAPPAPADAIRAFGTTRLRLIRGYRIGSDHPIRLYVANLAGDAAFQAIFRSARSILGWRAEAIRPSSWIRRPPEEKITLVFTGSLTRSSLGEVMKG